MKGTQEHENILIVLVLQLYPDSDAWYIIRLYVFSW